MLNYRLVLPLIAALAMTGCATTSRPSMSYVSPELTARDAEVLAFDTVDYLAEPLAPARTTLVLDPPAAGQHDALTTALVPTLRARGYGLHFVDNKTGKAAGEGVPLRYIAAPMDAGLLLRLQFQRVEVTRFYGRSKDGQLTAGAPFTVREVNQ